MFDNIFEPAFRRHRLLDFFAQQQPLLFQRFHLLFIRAHHDRTGRFDNAFQKLLDLFLGGLQVTFEVIDQGERQCEPLVPGAREHRTGQLEQAWRRLHGLQDGFKLALQDIARDGFAVADATLCIAEVVGVFFPGPLRPAGRQRLPAVMAQHKSAQGEIHVDILADRRFQRSGPPRLYPLENFEGDERFMLRGNQIPIPVSVTDVARIQGMGQNIRHALLRDPALCVLREGRLGFEKSFHLHLALETPAGIAFKRFLHDGRQRFVPHQFLAAALRFFVAITYRRA